MKIQIFEFSQCGIYRVGQKVAHLSTTTST